MRDLLISELMQGGCVCGLSATPSRPIRLENSSFGLFFLVYWLASSKWELQGWVLSEISALAAVKQK